MLYQLDTKEHSWLNEYSATVADIFFTIFEKNKERFMGGITIIDRFRSSVEKVRKKGGVTSTPQMRHTMNFEL